MPNQKISELTDGGALQSTDDLVVVRGGANFRVRRPASVLWERPSTWLAMPTIAGPTEQIVRGLHAVYPTGNNFVALNCSGNYTVNWGDGTTQNFAAGVTAERNISYAAIASQPNEGALGFRQCLIVVTPQATFNLTSIDFHRRHSAAPVGGYVSGFLDLDLNAPQMTTFLLAFAAAGKERVAFLSLATARIFATAWTSVASGALRLREIIQYRDIVLSASTTDFFSAWSQCYSLQSFPLINTAAVTNFGGAWQQCTSLQSFPLINTAAGTNFSYAWFRCYSLQSFPLINTAAGTDFGGAWFHCNSLSSFPLINTAAGKNFSYAWFECTSLQSFPLINTAAGTNFSYAWFQCYSLQSFPLINTAAGTDFVSAWQQCTSLQSFPLINTAAGTSAVDMLSSCPILEIGATSGLRFGTSYANCNLAAAQMNDIYTALGTASGAQTITMSGNPGSGSSTTSIATAKGWTVVGG